MKKCNKCGIDKNENEFHKRYDGYYRHCKSCELLHQKNHRKKLSIITKLNNYATQRLQTSKI